MRFQLAAPKGFSACFSGSAHTKSKLADSDTGILVFIIAINGRNYNGKNQKCGKKFLPFGGCQGKGLID
jgi:hypothetical protein